MSQKLTDRLRRRHTIRVVVNDREKKIIGTRAKSKVMSASGFLRWAGLCADIGPVEAEALEKVLREKKS